MAPPTAAPSAAKILFAIDLHCPGLLSGDGGPSRVHFVGGTNLQVWAETERFAGFLETAATGPIPFFASDSVPFGQSWNTWERRGAGTLPMAFWAAELPGVKATLTLEIPYSSAYESEMNQETARAFGRQLTTAIKSYLMAP